MDSKFSTEKSMRGLLAAHRYTTFKAIKGTWSHSQSSNFSRHYLCSNHLISSV